jgi:hypothetical protein
LHKNWFTRYRFAKKELPFDRLFFTPEQNKPSQPNTQPNTQPNIKPNTQPNTQPIDNNDCAPSWLKSVP